MDWVDDLLTFLDPTISIEPSSVLASSKVMSSMPFTFFTSIVLYPINENTKVGFSAARKEKLPSKPDTVPLLVPLIKIVTPGKPAPELSFTTPTT